MNIGPYIVEEVDSKFSNQVNDLVKYIEKLTDEHWERNKYRPEFKPSIGVDKGPKYWRIFRKDMNSRGVWGFVDTTNGNILFPKTWKAPDLKNPRGNVTDSSTWKRFTENSPQYLR